MSTTSSPTAGKIGQALNFDGNTNYVEAAQTSSLDITGDITITAWIRKATSGYDYGGIVAKTDGSSAWDYDFFVCDDTHSTCAVRQGELGMYTDGPGTFAYSNTPITDTRWHHVVFTRSGSTWTLYIDGAADNTGTQAAAFPARSLPLRIGTDGPGWNSIAEFNGTIDDVRVYNRALSAGEVKQLYNLGTANAAHSNVGISNGLVGYWPLDGAVTNWRTNTTADLSGQGNTGTLVNLGTTTAPVAGKIGQALKFDGSSSYVEMVNNTLDVTGDITVSAWLKMTNNAASKIPIKKYGGGGSEHGWLLMTYDVGDGRIEFDGRTGDGIYYSSGPSVTDIKGKWHHVVGMRRGSNWRIYIDGNLENSATGGTGTFAIADPLQIGGSAGINYFPGLIDDVRIYNRALSAAEVQQLYNMRR